MLVGALGAEGRAEVDAVGRIKPLGEGWTFGWWIGADDRWRVPANEPAVRSSTIGAAPVGETRVRVPSGDAITRAYGIGQAGLVVTEIENASPAAFLATATISGAHSIAVDDRTVVVDGRASMLLPSVPQRWSAGAADLDPEAVGAQTGPVAPVRDRAGRVSVAMLFPLSHRNRLRIAIAPTGAIAPALQLASLPSPADAARGWEAFLARHMTVDLPDAVEQQRVDLARTQIVLDPDPDAATTAALEDWGYDEEAARAWGRLSFRERRACRRRSDRLSDGAGPQGTLLRLRGELVAERSDGALDLLPGFRPAWRGAALEAHQVPTRAGVLSYALRWHGPRPALLWELDGRGACTLRCPPLDPEWSTDAPAGEALLRAA
ncbi:MAG TPA: hypothetical protein VIC35_03000 [Acidimicrobiia bacterium]